MIKAHTRGDGRNARQAHQNSNSYHCQRAARAPDSQRISNCAAPRSSVALTRPKLGFELGPREEKGQIAATRPGGEGRKFGGYLGNIGSSALRALDNLRYFNGFRGLLLTRNAA
jgi:hypothetical protein